MATVIIGGLIILICGVGTGAQAPGPQSRKNVQLRCGGCASGCQERRSQGGQEDGAGK